MYQTNEKCKFCSSEYKFIQKEYELRTRWKKHNSYVIDNLLVMECKVCGHSKLPESSEVIVNGLRSLIREQIGGEPSYSEEETYKELHSHPQSHPLQSIKGFFKKVIG